jgi:hypothetical protein
VLAARFDDPAAPRRASAISMIGVDFIRVR